MLYEKLQIFFTDVDVSKPKSSRNSSIEAFVVCQNYNPPKDYIPTMTPIDFGGKACSSNDQLKGSNRYTIPFIACGDLSGYDNTRFDSLSHNNGTEPKQSQKLSDNGKDKYDIGFIQLPVDPSYEEFLETNEMEVFSSGVSNATQMTTNDNNGEKNANQTKNITSNVAVDKKHEHESKNETIGNEVSIEDYKDGATMGTHGEEPHLPTATPSTSTSAKVALLGAVAGSAILLFCVAKFFHERRKSNSGNNRDTNTPQHQTSESATFYRS
ncbi:ribosomal RNA methyltransferase [Reticulomyxa filosa]|uniref:Ribosomal RNA methyltransferase n=1 Tax=Reticulomyxa filosa TaxID=46433 RepID=X6NLN6_RETFI|nr:ribosomal RNA methyltransferase [Reticulomyxa filosa]|eukprot:ETO26876.1 ribosomal RNA methyltransferase [Reticulomyxa filosa]